MRCTIIKYEFTGRNDGYVVVTAILEYDSKYLVEYPVNFIDDGYDDSYYINRAKALVDDQLKCGYLETDQFRLNKKIRETKSGEQPVNVEESNIETEEKKKTGPILWWLNQKIWVRASVYSLLSIGLVLSLTLPLIKGNGGTGGGDDPEPEPGYSIYGASVSDPGLTPEEAAAITMTDAEAVEGEAFNTTINIDKSILTNKVLPSKLEHVWTAGTQSYRSLNSSQKICAANDDIDIVDKCEYIVSEDLVNADIRVPAEYVNGDIRVEMNLSESEQVTLKINDSDQNKGWFIEDPSQPGVKTYIKTGVTTRKNEAPSSPSVFHLNEDLADKRYECVWKKEEANENVYVADFAEFQREYTVTFDPGEGSFKPGEEDKAFQVVKYNETIPAIPELNEPASSSSRYTSYSHAWYTDKEFTEKFSESTPVTSNLNLYAKWVYKKDYVELTALEDDDVFTFSIGGGANYAIESSYNARDWEPQTSPFISTSVNAGEKVYIRVKPASVGDVTVTSVHIDSTKTFNAGGNIMSLIDYTKDLTELGSSEFSYLFGASAGTGSPIVDASELILPATTVTESAYNGMFRSCKKLTDAPDLDSMVTVEKMGCGAMFYECSSLVNGPTTLGATTVGHLGYSNMFTDCSNLVEAPEMEVTTLGTEGSSGGNCSSMFLRCTELTTAPSILKPTTLTPDCYNAMFGHCEKLTTAPKIMATTYDANSCVKMFGNCYALTNAPDLEATTLGYNSCWMMFQHCNLLQKAPYLPATTLPQGCYKQMFEDCSALNEVKIAYDGDLPASNNATNEWLKNVAATGTIYYNGSSTTPSLDGSGIPYGWTIQPFSN